MNNSKDVLVLTGAGSIGIAIARRIGIGKHIVLADFNIKNAERESKTLYNAGFQTSVCETDISSRESILKLIDFSKNLGKIKYFVNAAGVSPSQAPIEDILKVDLYGTAVLLEEFGKVIEEGGSGVIISSQSGYRLGSLTDEENKMLATTPTEELLSMPILEKASDTLKAYLPYNAQVTPYIRLKSAAGRTVRILTDDYRGGSAPNVFAEYRTTDGEQDFECKGWMNGHCVYYIISDGVEVLDVQYRETGYDTRFAGSFVCDDQKLNTLWNKAQRTLYLTMRDTYMDCPDRERAQWWGDVVNELGEAFYALDEKAHLLTRKGIHELMDWQRADSTIYAPVPSGNYKDELPMQMLASVGYYGFWTYYTGSGDRQTIEYVYPKVKKYIHVWKTGSNQLIIPRSGGWTWGDWGDYKDMELLFNQWYIIALDGYARKATLVGDKDEALWAQNKAEVMRRVFHETYWNGSCYASAASMNNPDDRAQALAVVSGTLPDSLYSVIRPFFKKVFHASPYMEKYVLQALCHMGYYEDALNRMKLRYEKMIDSPLTTLWEGWGIGSEGFGGGTYNHAWSGGPLTILSQYIAGIETMEPAFKCFKVEPHPAHLNHIRAVVPLSGGREIRMVLDRDASGCIVVLDVPSGTQALFVPPLGYENWQINGRSLRTPSKRLKRGHWVITGYTKSK